MIMPLKRYYTAILFLVFFSNILYAQVNITGRVVDDKDDAPVSHANVYFNNTSIAAQTNAQGDFTFKNLTLLNTELVISSNGYDVLTYKPDEKQVLNKRLVFKLHARLPDTVARPAINALLQRAYMDALHQNFLGLTEEAAQSSIYNEAAIYFIKSADPSAFFAYADTPLIIINNMLGYKITFDLVEFSYNEETEKSYFSGYCHYADIDDTGYKKNRQRAYLGSSMHFYRSLINHQLYQQGFNTFLLPQQDTAFRSRLQKKGVNIDERMLAKPIAAEQILHIDSTNNFSIGIKGRLLVQYIKNPYAKKYLQKTTIMQGYLDKGVESVIHFITSPIELNSAGMPIDAGAVQYSGYWGYEKLANLLPIDYKPD